MRYLQFAIFSTAMVLLIVLAVIMESCTPQTSQPQTPSVPSPTPAQPPTTTPAQQPGAVPQAEPKVIKSWQGSDTKKTETFTITKDSWQIRWSSDPQVDDSSKVKFQIYVYATKLSTFPISIAANTQKKESGTDISRNQGTFYLLIDAANTKWTVEVLE